MSIPSNQPALQTTPAEIHSGIHPAWNVGVASVLGKVLLDELRTLSQRMNDYVGNPAHVKLSVDLRQVLGVCNLVGFAGVRTYTTALIDLCELIEAGNDSVPRLLTIERAKVVHAALTTFGWTIKKLSHGERARYRDFKTSLDTICSYTGDTTTPALFMPAFPSLEVPTGWQPRNPHQTVAFRQAGKAFSAEAAQWLAQCASQYANRDPDAEQTPALSAGLRAELDLCVKTNPHKELQGYYELLAVLCDCPRSVASASAFMQALEASIPLTTLAVDASAGMYLQTVPMSEALHAAAKMIAEAKDDGASATANGSSALRAMAGHYGLKVEREGNHEMYQTFRERTKAFVDHWGKAATSDNVLSVAKHTGAFAKGAAKLNNPLYEGIAVALDEVSQDAAKKTVAPYEFWVNGALALTMMQATVDTMGLVEKDAERRVGIDIADRLRRQCPVAEPMQCSPSMVSHSSRLGVSAVFREISSRLQQAEQLVNEVFTVRQRQGSAAAPNAVAATTGAKIVKLLLPLGGIFEFLSMPRAKAATLGTISYALNKNCWAFDDEGLKLFEGLAGLSLFASRIRPGALVDMADDGGELPQEATQDEIEMAILPEASTPDPALAIKPAAGESSPDANFIDSPNDEALLDVFLVEAITLVADARSMWLGLGDNITNVSVLGDVRRDFHTLKGSGNTAGLTHMGSAAEAVQFCLDKWVDASVAGKLELTPALLELSRFVLSSLTLMEEWLFSLQAAGHLRAPRSKLEQCIAEAGRLQSLAPAGVPLEELLASEEVLSGTSATPQADGVEITPAQPTPISTPTITSTSSLPADAQTSALSTVFIDVPNNESLLEVFLREAVTLIADAREMWLGLGDNITNVSVLGDVRRDFHTLKGSGNTAGLTHMGSVIEAIQFCLDKWVDAGVAGKLELTPDLLDLSRFVLSSLDMLDDWLFAIKDEGCLSAPLSDMEQCIAEADRLRSLAPAGISMEDSLTSEDALDTRQDVVEITQLQPVPAAEPIPVPTQTTPAALKIEPQPDESASLFIDSPNDDSLLEVFLPEAIALVADAREMWIGMGGNLTNLSILGDVRRAFHTLKGSGNTAGFIHMASAAEGIQNCLDAWMGAANAGKIEQSPTLLELSQFVLSSLNLMESWLDIMQATGFVRAPLSSLDQCIAQAEHLRSLAPAGAQLDEWLGDETGEVATELKPEMQPATPLGTPESAPGPAAILPVQESQGDVGEVTFEAMTWDTPAPIENDNVPAAPVTVLTPVEELSAQIKAAVFSCEDTIDITNDIIGVLLPEANDLLLTIESALATLESETGQPAELESLSRAVHGLKGAMRTAGALKAGAVLHALEEDFGYVTIPQMTLERVGVYRYGIDLVATFLDDIAVAWNAPKKMPETVVEPEIQPAVSLAPVESQNIQKEDPASDSAGAPVFSLPAQRPSPTLPSPHAAPAHQPSVSIRSDSLDRIELRTGEAVVLQNRAGEEIGEIWRNLREMSMNIDRLNDLMKGLEMQADIRMGASMQSSSAHAHFDPLELDRFSALQDIVRSMNEAIQDIRVTEEDLGKSLLALELTENRKVQLSVDLQRDISQLMVVPLSSEKQKLSRILRLASEETNKIAELVFEGDADLPGTVMTKLSSVLGHIVRNAMAHGIETAPVRATRHKPVSGKITVRVASTPDKITIMIQDDGAGIDTQVILAKAREKELATQREYTEQEIYGFLFMSGLSTAETVTSLAGRGVGLDAVKATLQEIGGEIFVSSVLTKGTEFRIEAPADITTISVVPVTTEGQLCLVPSSLVERIVSIPTQQAVDAAVRGTLSLDGIEYRFLRMGWLVSDTSHPARRATVHLLLCGAAAGNPAAFEVGDIAAYQKVLIRPLGRHISGISGLIAGTTLADGSVALIVNPLRMRVIGRDASAQDMRPALPLVMVVDDSATIRQFTTKFLRAMGIDVLEAKDGLDALDLLRNFNPDMFLLDVEMPRMGGFELASALRGDDRFKDTPIAMVTSRTAQKHREHAARLGVNEYIGKPFEETELRRVLEKYLELVA